ncbi:MAG: hypothetical protein ACLFUJ_01945 [Phycisphaerae bacterium]
MSQASENLYDFSPGQDLLVHAARVAERHDLDPLEVLRMLVDLALIRRGLGRQDKEFRAAAAYN